MVGPLSLTQDIFNGFNMSNSTPAIFINFEKVYDSVWRKGLVVKLSRSGVKREHVELNKCIP